MTPPACHRKVVVHPAADGHDAARRFPSRRSPSLLPRPLRPLPYPTSDIALSVSIFAIGLAVSLLLIGPLSDMFGRKKLLLGGIALAAVGATGCLFASDFAWFLGFRVVQAVGCGSFALSQALVQDLFAGRELERLRIWMTTAGGFSSPVRR